MSSHLGETAILMSLYLSSGGKVEKIIKKTEKLICDLAIPEKPGCFKQIAEFLGEVEKELKEAMK
jgi:hypothetical protein